MECPRLSISLTFQARELGAARTGAVHGHQNSAIERSRRSIDELCCFFLTENSRQAIALLRIGSVGNAPRPLERLDVEEAQSAQWLVIEPVWGQLSPSPRPKYGSYKHGLHEPVPGVDSRDFP